MKFKKLLDIYGDDVDNFLLEVQMGQIPGVSVVWKFGRNENITTSEYPIWSKGATALVWPTSASLLSLVSTAADTVEITIEGLDLNHKPIEDSITLTGTTPVNSNKAFLRVNRAYNSNGIEAIGNIDISHSGNTIAYLPDYAQQTLQAFYTIPAGYTGFLFQGVTSTGKLKDANIYFKHRLFGKTFRMAETFGVYENTYEGKRPYIPFPEKTDLIVNAVSSSSGTDVSAEFGLILIKNEE